MDLSIGQKIIEDDLSSVQIQDLIKTHLAQMNSQSPPESVHALAIEGLKKPNIKLFSLWNEAQLMGCGAIQIHKHDFAEVKSMHTYEVFRRHGIGQIILSHIIEYAKNIGVKTLNLETGSSDNFIAARNLYLRNGFTPCGPFANYIEDSNSCFFTKEI